MDTGTARATGKANNGLDLPRLRQSVSNPLSFGNRPSNGKGGHAVKLLLLFCILYALFILTMLGVCFLAAGHRCVSRPDDREPFGLCSRRLFKVGGLLK